MDAKKETEMVPARLLTMLEETIVQKQPIIYIGEKRKINTDIMVSFTVRELRQLKKGVMNFN